jgi:hypothetical protein
MVFLEASILHDSRKQGPDKMLAKNTLAENL